ncbi:Phage minor capsid protein 2 [uncultured Mediterranean phage uvMED]|nr:Phage minor capsid protein 2 [uncultured Mediterranean phage uvMED]BAQ90940.1 Phage minor capsid protein 2 [uncultured Mediterranean phage uvMED]
MSAILDKLADQHEERLINVLYTLENDIINSVRKTTVAGTTLTTKLAIELQPQLRSSIENIFLNEADLIINEDYDKIAKEVLDTFGKMPIPAKFKNLTKIDLQTITALKYQSFSGFEDIAERFLKVINDEIYQSAIVGRPFADVEKNIRSHINGVYQQSNQREINELVDFINENKFVESQKTAVQSAVTKLQTEYAADRAGENLRRYAGQIAHDSVMQVHGQFTVKKAKESGLKHFTYTGTLVRDSRPFCVNMVGRTLTEKQIRDRWNSQSWKGKSSGDPFIVRGGYRCRHTWIPTNPDWNI